MRRKLVEQTPPPKCRKKGWWTIVQEIENIIVLNIFCGGSLKSRHCIDISKKDYATWLPRGEWTARKIEWSYDIETEWQYRYYNKNKVKLFRLSDNDKNLLFDKFKDEDELGRSELDMTSIFALISQAEYEWACERREEGEKRRQKRVEDVMSKIPPLPDDIEDWFYKTAVGEDFAFKDEDTGEFVCTICHNGAPREKYTQDNGEPVRNNDIVSCPHCGSRIRFKTRKRAVFASEDVAVVQPVDDTMSVIRFCMVFGKVTVKETDVHVYEKIRILTGRGANTAPYKNVYYRQCGGKFDNKSNSQQHKIADKQYMYPIGIKEALEGTKVEAWTELFTEFAAAGMELAYDDLITCFDGDMYTLMELLFRGRFYKLMSEESGRFSSTGPYCGVLNIKGTSMEEVFRISDRQLINRLRDRNGDRLMLEWLQWSERNHKKLSDKVLAWLMKNRLHTSSMAWAKLRFSPEQAMNYIERQRREQYSGKSIREVISQYEDYMDMCRRLKKDTSDEIVFRPRELRRRHDEAAAEIKEREAEITADEYSQRYPNAEKVLKEIAGKLEYRNDKYMIIVPEKNIDIVKEGRALHHCAGASDRYFDRIAQNETYICFLRKTEEPDKPYYTIEVEPGGTIRQHRGMDDEEPEIEEVKPFLREWQREIRKRMSHEDHELAAASRQKREENIRELQEKNNTRVLEGLMEDFMEAAGY